jgi:hypothetical protein
MWLLKQDSHRLVTRRYYLSCPHFYSSQDKEIYFCVWYSLISFFTFWKWQINKRKLFLCLVKYHILRHMAEWSYSFMHCNFGTWLRWLISFVSQLLCPLYQLDKKLGRSQSQYWH